MIKGNKGDVMKKNKGFTLVELLAVIVILAIVSLVAVPSINGLLRKSRTNMFCKKVESIEAAAKYYAQDNLSDLASDSKMVIANKIPIRLLVEKGYLKKDSDNCIVGSNCVTDPRDKSSLDNNYIDIYSENNRLHGRYLYNNDDANNKVCGKKITYNVNEYGTYSSTENPLANEYTYFDVNSSMNPSNMYSDLPIYFDVYIDGKLVKKDTTDFCSEQSYKKGQTYMITNIRPRNGYSCSEYGFGNVAGTASLSGIITDTTTSIDVICVKK